MIFGKGYMTNDLFYTCSALVAQARFSKKDHKAYAGQLEDHYSQHFLDNNLKKDFLKAADLLYKRVKKLKYKNDKERASVLLDYQNSITVPAKKKLFGGTAFNKANSPDPNRAKGSVKDFNEWLKKSFLQDAFSEAFSGKY